MSDRNEISQDEVNNMIKQTFENTMNEVQQNKNYLRYGEAQNYSANNQKALRKAVKSTIAKQKSREQDDFSISSLMPFIVGFIVFIIICVIFSLQNG